MFQQVRAQKRGDRLIVLAVAAAILVALASALALASAGPAASIPPGDFYDESAVDGQAPNKTPEEQRAALDRVVEEGSFALSIASVIVFPSLDASGEAFIENAPNNPYDLAVSIALADTGEVVYASKGIAPNSYIRDIRLASALAPGRHEAVATFTARDRETHAEKGTAAAKVTLVVE